jgi:hypothetical protein
MSLLLILVVVAPAAAKKNPPGNNGTVKVDRMAFDEHPNNQPHVGCQFQVDFYGFDVDPSYFATVAFELHAPTANGRTMEVISGDLTPFIGEDDNSGAGSEAGLDAAETYTLAFTGAPHAQQGYHVKLTVHAPGSHGADTKHKVFWVEGCTPTIVPPTEPPSNPPGGGTDPDDPPREDTEGGSGASGVVLPDTAMGSGPSSAAAMLIGALMLAAGTTRVLALARRPTRR